MLTGTFLGLFFIPLFFVTVRRLADGEVSRCSLADVCGSRKAYRDRTSG